MDLESLYDSSCIYDKKIEYDKNYSYESGIKEYLNLLDKYNIKATIFTLLSSLDNSKDYLIDAIKNNHEVALHGYNHSSPLEMDLDDFKAKTIEAKFRLEKELNTKIQGFRAPCFGINEELIKTIKNLGFKYDSSSFDFPLAMKSGSIDLSHYKKISNEIYKDNDFYEFPLAKVKAYGGNIPICGGGYIRLVPWFVIKYYIKKYIKKTDSYIFYCHPYEIIKDKLPKFKGLNWKERLYLKIGRKSYIKKIEWLIKYLKKQGFEFKTMSETIKA